MLILRNEQLDTATGNKLNLSDSSKLCRIRPFLFSLRIFGNRVALVACATKIVHKFVFSYGSNRVNAQTFSIFCFMFASPWFLWANKEIFLNWTKTKSFLRKPKSIFVFTRHCCKDNLMNVNKISAYYFSISVSTFSKHQIPLFLSSHFIAINPMLLHDAREQNPWGIKQETRKSEEESVTKYKLF